MSELRLWKRDDRGGTYYVTGEIFNTRVTFSTFEKEKDQADLVLADFIAREKAKLHNEKEEVTFNEVAIEHLLCEGKSSIAKDEEYIGILEPYIGNIPYNKIKRPMRKPSVLTPLVEDCVKRKLSITTVNKYLAFINTLGSKAVRKYDFDFVWQPVPLVSREEAKKLGLKPPVKKKHLTREMETLLINLLPDYLKPMVKLAINTGFREALLCGLKWEWLKKDNDTVWYFEIPAEEMKNYRYLEGDDDQVFVLNSIAREIIRQRLSNGSEYVFPLPGSCGLTHVKLLNTTSYRTARRRGALRIPDLAKTDVHSFRRTFLTRLRERRVPEKFEKYLMGHKTKDVTDRYARVSEEMRQTFYDYAEMIVGDKKIPIRLFKAN